MSANFRKLTIRGDVQKLADRTQLLHASFERAERATTVRKDEFDKEVYTLLMGI